MIDQNRMHSVFVSLLTIVIFSSVTHTSAADIAVGFTGDQNDISRAFFTPSGTFDSGIPVQGMRYATSFTMGGTSRSLASIEVPLLVMGTNDDVTVTFSIYSNGLLSSPDTLYASQTNAAFKPNAEMNYYTANFSSPTLVASTQYWLVVELVTTTATDAPMIMGVTDAAYSSLTTTVGTPNFDLQVNSGSGWTSTVNNTNFVASIVDPPTAAPYSIVYNLNVVPVPEPSTYALGAIASVVIGVIARRRRNAKTD